MVKSSLAFEEQGQSHRRELQHCCHPERSEGSLAGPSADPKLALRACPDRSEGMTDGGREAPKA